MKKLLAAIISLCIVGGSLPAVYSGAPECVITASAEEEYTEVTEGSLTYHVYEDHAEVSKCAEDTEGEIIIPSSVNNLPVTSIGAYAFSRCESLTAITIPDSVTSIGNNAYFCCTSLTSITIPDSVVSIGVEAFLYCPELTSITISDSVTSIGESAFQNCEKLESITIPDSVATIGDDAFRGCSSLESIVIGDSVTSIGNGPFFDCISLKSIEVSENNDYYTSIDGVLFNKKKTNLIKYPIDRQEKEYIIPDSVTNIAGYAFYDHSNITFYSGSRLESITIPDSVTSIGMWAFGGCSKLTSIDIPVSVTSIGANAFYDTPWLESKRKEDPLVIVNGILIDGYTCLGDVIIPDSVTIIGDCAFSTEFYRSLTSISIPDSVTRIGDSAFSHCTDLKSVTIPVSVTSIGRCAFCWCLSLESITILNPDCEISDWADTISDDEFNGGYKGTIYGYKGSTAQAYAEKYGYKFESIGEAPTDESTTGTELKKGDANGDDEVNMSDVVMVMQAALNPKKYGVNGTSEDRITAEGEKAADVDCKEGLSANDALIIQKFSLRIIESL